MDDLMPMLKSETLWTCALKGSTSANVGQITIEQVYTIYKVQKQLEIFNSVTFESVEDFLLERSTTWSSDDSIISLVKNFMDKNNLPYGKKSLQADMQYKSNIRDTKRYFKKK